MDDVELRRGEEQKRCAQLLRKLPREVEGDAAEVCVPQQVVEVVGEQFEDQTQVVAEHEVLLQLHCNGRAHMVMRKVTLHHPRKSTCCPTVPLAGFLSKP